MQFTRRWPEYFERMLNTDEDETMIAAIGERCKVSALEKLNSILIKEKELCKTVSEMRKGRGASLDVWMDVLQRA